MATRKTKESAPQEDAIIDGDVYTVVSTHPMNLRYTKYNRTKDSIEHLYDYTILGGAGNVKRTKNGGVGDIPDAVKTKITGRDLKLLRDIPEFVQDEKDGTIRVIKKSPSAVDAKKESETMGKVRGMKQLTEQDFIDAGATIDEGSGNIEIENVGKNNNVMRKLRAKNRKA